MGKDMDKDDYRVHLLLCWLEQRKQHEATTGEQ